MIYDGSHARVDETMFRVFRDALSRGRSKYFSRPFARRRERSGVRTGLNAARMCFCCYRREKREEKKRKKSTSDRETKERRRNGVKLVHQSTDGYIVYRGRQLRRRGRGAREREERRGENTFCDSVGRLARERLRLRRRRRWQR